MAPRTGELYDPSAEDSPPKKKTTPYGSARTHVTSGGGGSKSAQQTHPASSVNASTVPPRKSSKSAENPDSSLKSSSEGSGSSDSDSEGSSSEGSESEGSGGEESEDNEESEDSEDGGDSEDNEDRKSKGRQAQSQKKAKCVEEERQLLKKLLKKFGAPKSTKQNKREKVTPVSSSKHQDKKSKSTVGTSSLKPNATGSSKRASSKSIVAEVEPEITEAKSKRSLKGPKLESETKGEATDISQAGFAPGVEGMTAYIRTIFTRLGGWQNLQDISAQPLGIDNRPTYWVSENGSQKLRPNWEATFDVNWKVWGDQFMSEFRHGEGFTGDVNNLKGITDSVVRGKLATTWKHCQSVWKIKKSEHAEAAQRGKLIRMAGRNRQVAKLNKRIEDMEGTILSTDNRFRFLQYRELQSPEASDAEDKNHKVIDDPRWRSEPYRRLLGALNQKAKGSKKRSSAAKKDKVSYIKVDTPIPTLTNNQRIPRWAIDDAYYEAHKDEMEENAFMIDLTVTTVPNLYEDFIRLYGKENRTYLEVRPAPAKPRVSSSRSVSPVTHRQAPSGDSVASGCVNPSFVNPDNIDPSLLGENPPSVAQTVSALEPPPDNGRQLLPHASQHNAMELSMMYRDAQALEPTRNFEPPTDLVNRRPHDREMPPPPELNQADLPKSGGPKAASVLGTDSETITKKRKNDLEEGESASAQKKDDKKRKKIEMAKESEMVEEIATESEGDKNQDKKKKKKKGEHKKDGKSKGKGQGRSKKGKGKKNKAVDSEEVLEDDDVPVASGSRAKGSIHIRVQGD